METLYHITTDCGPLENPVNGHITITGNRELSRLEADSVCDPNFVLNGPGQLICEIEGQWSGPEPTCDGPSIEHIFYITHLLATDNISNISYIYSVAPDHPVLICEITDLDKGYRKLLSFMA